MYTKILGLRPSVIRNFIKCVDDRLLDSSFDVKININILINEDIQIIYHGYRNNDITILVTDRYITVNYKNDTCLMYDGDESGLSVKERLFNLVIELLGEIMKREE